MDAALRQEQAYFNVDLGNRDDVVRGLCPAIESPLGPAAGLRLRDVTRPDRLDELGFELPLVGGDDATARRTATSGSPTLRRLLSSTWIRAIRSYAYADRLRDPALGDDPLRGFLTGSLDLVLRLPDGRFVLADYKTNRLGAADEILTAWHYRPAAIEGEMAEAHYPLQALLYSVALHRYLRWRQPDYDPARHLGGALYLFLRGMSAVGADALRGHAVRGLVVVPSGRARHGAERSLRPGGAPMTTVETAVSASIAMTCPSPPGPPGPCAPSTGRGSSTAPTSTWRTVWRNSPPSSGEDVGLGIAFAARAPRLGHVCVDLRTIRHTASGDVDLPTDVDALPWPDPAAWLDALARARSSATTTRSTCPGRTCT